MTDTDRSGIDAFESFRAYLEKEVAPLLPLDKREEILDGIVRAAYTFGGALLRRGAGGSGELLAFTQYARAQEPDEEEEPHFPKPDNVVGFPPPREAPEDLS